MAINRPTDDAALLADLRRRIEALELSSQLGGATIGDGGLRVLDGGAVEVYDGSDVLRVEITAGTITIYDASGDVRWTAGTAWASTVAPDTTSFELVSGTTWTDVATYLSRSPAGYVEVGTLVNPFEVDTGGQLRLVDDSDSFSPEVLTTVTGLQVNVSATPYAVRIAAETVPPQDTDYQRIVLQARTSASRSMGVEALEAAFGA